MSEQTPEPKNLDSKKSMRSELKKLPSTRADPKPAPIAPEVKAEPVPSSPPPPAAAANSDPKILDSNKSERRLDSVMSSLRKLGSILRSKIVRPSAPNDVDSKRAAIDSKSSHPKKPDSNKAAADPSSTHAASSGMSSVRSAKKSVLKNVDSNILTPSQKSSTKKPTSAKSAKTRKIGKKLDATSMALQKIKEKNLQGVDNLIARLLCIGIPTRGLTKTVPEADIIHICERVYKIFGTQPMFIEIEPPVKVVGDIHGQYIDYLHMLDRNGWPGKTNYIVGFKQECIRRYNSVRMYDQFNRVFSVMPLSGLIGGRILCMHGGISRHLQKIEQLRKIPRPLEDVDDDELAVDLLWADPNPDAKGFQSGIRGTSCCFGADAVTTVCQKLNIDMVCRAHQVVQDGYEFFANRKMVTVFSAPNYCGQFNNAGAIMNVDSGMSCSFTVCGTR